MDALHHANLLVGTRQEAESYLTALCGSLGIKLVNNPDFVTFRSEVFGVDEARQLSLMAVRKALTNQKIFLISAGRLTVEAQNALLKAFEDPFPATHFFLVASEEGLILSTLRSRMNVVTLSRGRNSHLEVGLPSDQVDSFLHVPIKNRLLLAKNFAEGKGDLADFLDKLLLSSRQNDRPVAVKKIYEMRGFARDQVALRRLIIEHLALVL